MRDRLIEDVDPRLQGFPVSERDAGEDAGEEAGFWRRWPEILVSIKLSPDARAKHSVFGQREEFAFDDLFAWEEQAWIGAQVQQPAAEGCRAKRAEQGDRWSDLGGSAIRMQSSVDEELFIHAIVFLPEPNAMLADDVED